MDFGYIRVSSTQQNPQRQIDLLLDAGVEECNLFIDKESGTKRSRPALDDMLSRLRSGDRVFIVSFDRLARSMSQLLSLTERFQKEGIELVSLKEKIDTSTPQGRLFFMIAASFASFEREVILERQKDGIESAKKAGRKLGRKPADSSKVQMAFTLHDSGNYTIAESCERAGISQSVYYRERRKQREQQSA